MVGYVEDNQRVQGHRDASGDPCGHNTGAGYSHTEEHNRWALLLGYLPINKSGFSDACLNVFLLGVSPEPETRLHTLMVSRIQIV